MKGIGEIERAVLSLKDKEQLDEMLISGISKRHFIQYKEVFDFTLYFYKTYSKLPSKELLKKRFDFEPIETDDHNYMVDELKKLRLRYDLSNIIEEGIEQLEEEPTEALDFLANKIMELKSMTIETNHLSFTDRDAVKRAIALADRMILANQQNTLGITTGVEVYDRVIGGWLSGQLIAIIGRTEHGKSWTMTNFCVEAYKAGNKILYISPEMTIVEVELRFDALMSRKFKNLDLLLGKSTIDVGEYKSYLQQLEKRADWITYDSIPGGQKLTLSSIQSLVHLHEPDLLAVDGVPLIADETGGETGWMKMVTIGYGLKGMAMNNGIAVICTSQANREAAQQGRMPALHQISYGDALGQACDKVISIKKISPDKIKMALVKNRGGKIISELYFNFDVDNGIIERYKEEEEDDWIDDEE